MLKSFLILLGAAGSLLSAAPSFALGLPDTGTVLVMARQGKDGKYCSGVALTDHWVLTAVQCCGEKVTQIIPVPGSSLGHEPETQIADACKQEGELALAYAPKPLPANIRPAKRFLNGQIVKGTAALDLKDKGPRYLATLTPSVVEAGYAGYHGAEAAGGQRVMPVSAKLNVIGFDLAQGRALFAVKDKGDGFEALGPGVFLDDGGTMKLIGIAVGAVTGGDQVILQAADVRTVQTWLDETTTKVP